MTDNQQQLKCLINEVLEVVDASNAGPLYLDGEHANPIAVVVLRSVLDSIISRRGYEPKEPWEE